MPLKVVLVEESVKCQVLVAAGLGSIKLLSLGGITPPPVPPKPVPVLSCTLMVKPQVEVSSVMVKSVGTFNIGVPKACSKIVSTPSFENKPVFLKPKPFTESVVKV